MKKIYKYPIPVVKEFSLKLPVGAQILSFQSQHAKCYIWVMVDIDAKVEARHFYLFGTGHPINKFPKKVELHYIGTTQPTPYLVWHLFEEVKHG